MKPETKRKMAKTMSPMLKGKLVSLTRSSIPNHISYGVIISWSTIETYLQQLGFNSPVSYHQGLWSIWRNSPEQAIADFESAKMEDLVPRDIHTNGKLEVYYIDDGEFEIFEDFYAEEENF